jgi:hypothetical protein
LELMDHTSLRKACKLSMTLSNAEDRTRYWQLWWWAVVSASQCHWAHSMCTNTLFETHVSWMHYVMLWWHCLASQFPWPLYNPQPSSRHLEAKVYANKLAHLTRLKST